MDEADRWLTVVVPIVWRLGSDTATTTSNRFTDSGASWTSRSSAGAGMATSGAKSEAADFEGVAGE